MSLSRFKRAKVFTDGKQTPLDRNDRARVMSLARIARREGHITFSAIEILNTLLFTFANLKDGRCFTSLEKIAMAAGISSKTVSRCLPKLESLGFITWVNRITRVRERVDGLKGIYAYTWRVKRTSNSYDFPMVAKNKAVSSDKRHFDLGTTKQDSFFDTNKHLDPNNELDQALLNFGMTTGYLKTA